MATKSRRSIRTALVVLVALSVLAPQTSHAAKRTYKPPFAFGTAYRFCLPRSAYGTSTCSGLTTADARTGTLRNDVRITSPNAGTALGNGVAQGLGLVYGGASIDAIRSVPVTFTLLVRSATASTPTPHSTAATGSTAIAGVQIALVHPGCERDCVVLKTVLIAEAGRLDAVTAVKNKTVTVKMTLRHRLGRRMPPGGFAFGVVSFTFVTLGGYTRKPVPIEGIQLPDVGSTRAQLDVVVKSVTVG